MDFLQFLKSNPDPKPQFQKESTNCLDDTINNGTLHSDVKFDTYTQDSGKQHVDSNFIQYKKGDFIRIVHVENSIHNFYKGYNGEIRTYTSGSDTATVTLEALNSTTPIKFSIKHFSPRNIEQLID